MPGSEEFIQSAVHALEAGGLAVWVKRGAVALDRYRGRAGTPRPVQEADHARLASTGSLPVEALA